MCVIVLVMVHMYVLVMMCVRYDDVCVMMCVRYDDVLVMMCVRYDDVCVMMCVRYDDVCVMMCVRYDGVCVSDGCIVCACNDASVYGRREYFYDVLFDWIVKLYGL